MNYPPALGRVCQPPPPRAQEVVTMNGARVQGRTGAEPCPTLGPSRGLWRETRTTSATRGRHADTSAPALPARSPRPAPTAARPPAAATRCRTVVWLNIPPNPVAICRLGAAARLSTLNSQPSTINYLEPRHLPDLIQQLEFGVGRDQVPAPGHWRRQSAALALTLPIRLHRI